VDLYVDSRICLHGEVLTSSCTGKTLPYPVIIIKRHVVFIALEDSRLLNVFYLIMPLD
jgi:hypothetical protein